MNKYYITFGFAHKDRKGNSLANCYTIIEAETREKAREIMFKSRGPKWAFMYNTAQEAGVIKYGMMLVPFNLL